MNVSKIILGAAAAISGLCTSTAAYAWNVDVQLTADNAYAIYTGDANGVSAFHGGDENVTAADIRAAESYSFTMADGEAIYVAAWSDDGIAQGLLAEFNIDGTILTTSNSDWEVMATGIDLDVSSSAPSLVDLSAQIALANAGAVPSGGWVPSTIGVLNDGNSSVYGTQLVSSMASTINWAWYDSGNCSSANQPFSGGCNHDEYLVFRLPLPLGGCCLEDGSCVNTTEEKCETGGGVFAGAGEFCELEQTCLPTGACCMGDYCEDDLTEQDCEDNQGTWYGEGSDCLDADVECPVDNEGACCIGEACYELSEHDCVHAGGYFYGEGTTCTDAVVECEPEEETGACCVDETCYDLTEDQCRQKQGVFYGLGSACSDAALECEPVEETGACCIDEACYDLTEEECRLREGAFYGAGSDCSDEVVECEPVDVNDGACCLEAECVELSARECWEEEGAFYGPGSTCEDAQVECCGSAAAVSTSTAGAGCSTANRSSGGGVGLLSLLLLGSVLVQRRRD